MLVFGGVNLIWSNYSDLTQVLGPQKVAFRKGNSYRQVVTPPPSMPQDTGTIGSMGRLGIFYLHEW